MSLNKDAKFSTIAAVTAAMILSSSAVAAGSGAPLKAADGTDMSLKRVEAATLFLTGQPATHIDFDDGVSLNECANLALTAAEIHEKVTISCHYNAIPFRLYNFKVEEGAVREIEFPSLQNTPSP